MLSYKNYFSLLIIFATIFIMFITFALSLDTLAGTNPQVLARPNSIDRRVSPLLSQAFDQDAPKSGQMVKYLEDNPKLALITSTDKDDIPCILREWSIYNKYRYKEFTSIPPLDDLGSFDLLIFGELSVIDEDDQNQLIEYGNLGIPLIFTELPSFNILKQFPGLADFFGIKECVDSNYPIDGIKVFEEFFLSKERIYQEGDDYGTENFDLEIPYYILRSGYEVYAVGTLQDQGAIENEELPAILWRTYSGSSFVFVVNGQVFTNKSILGIITSFLSQSYKAYLYPVINANTIAILNYPTFSQENEEEIRHRYMRDPQSFKREILLPNIVKVLKSYNQSYDFFLLPRLKGKEGPILHEDDIDYYWKEIAKLQGTGGLSIKDMAGLAIDETIEYNGEFFNKAFPDFRFTALYGGSFTLSEIEEYLGNNDSSLFEDISLVLFDPHDDCQLFQYLDRGILALSTTKDGYKHAYIDDLQMIALETALGLCVHQVDIGQVLAPEKNQDSWSQLAEKWSAGKTYYNDFKHFEGSSIYELEAKTRDFLELNYKWSIRNNKINIDIDRLGKETYFILRLHNMTIDKINGGTYQEILSGAYLIKAEKANMVIDLKETNVFPLQR